MSTQVAARGSSATTSTGSFATLGGAGGIVAGATTFLYSIAFVVLKEPTLYSTLQLVGSMAATLALVALYRRVRAVDEGLALWATALGLVGGLGSAIHGAYDLANALNPPRSDVLAEANLPNLVDPRGFLTFAVSGLSLIGVSWLIARSRGLPGALAYLGYLVGALMIVTWLARLIVLDATSILVLLPAALTGFLANPAWYLWLGLVLLRQRPIDELDEAPAAV